MDIENNEDVVEQTVETGEQPVAASEQPTGDEPTGDAAQEGAAPAGTPEGEVTLDPEAQLAAEALAATEETVPEVKETVPVAVVAGLRAKIRARDELLESVRTELVALKKPPEPIVEPSPLEKWVADNPEDAEVSGPPAKVLVADRKWQEEQAQRKAQTQATETLVFQGQESQARARAMLPDYDDVLEVGFKYLSPGDKVDIAMSKDKAMELYKRCQRATLQSGTPDAAIMRQHLQAKLAKTTKSAPAKAKGTQQPGQGTQAVRKPAPATETVALTPAVARMRALVDL